VQETVLQGGESGCFSAAFLDARLQELGDVRERFVSEKWTRFSASERQEISN
jgi:hypothetical protein